MTKHQKIVSIVAVLLTALFIYVGYSYATGATKGANQISYINGECRDYSTHWTYDKHNFVGKIGYRKAYQAARKECRDKRSKERRAVYIAYETTLGNSMYCAQVKTLSDQLRDEHASKALLLGLQLKKYAGDKLTFKASMRKASNMMHKLIDTPDFNAEQYCIETLDLGKELIK